MKKINLLLLLLIGLIGLLIESWPEAKLKLVFCNVGQGDAILMSYKDKQVLVDTGPNQTILSCLGKNMAFWDRKIEAVLLTHKQKDHVGGLAAMKDRYEIGQIMNESTEIEIGDFNLKQIYGEWGEDNTKARVFLGKFKNFNWLLTADITEKEERLIIEKLQPVEVLKVAHHGSKYSTSEAFLQVVRPQLAVISVGKNSFGHPTQETLKRLERVGAKVLRTDKNGQIVIVSDGRSWYIKSDAN